MLSTELLAALLEAGEENLPTLANTALAAHPDAAPTMLLAEVESALAALAEQGYVELTHDGDWRPLTPTERATVLPLTDSLGWDQATGRWHWTAPALRPYGPTVVLTPAGADHTRHLLRSA
jgi:hypothetical protein